MAYPPPSSRPPPQQHYGGLQPSRGPRRGGGGGGAGPGWQQQPDPGYNNGYQQEWDQGGYGDYQDYDNGYDQYGTNPAPQDQYQDEYAARGQGRSNDYGQATRQNQWSDQGYADYNGYQEPPRGDPRQHNQGYDRNNSRPPPPQNYQQSRPTNGGSGGRGGSPRSNPSRGPPNGAPAPTNGYGPSPGQGQSQGSGPGPRPPRDPRGIHPPPSQYGRPPQQAAPPPEGKGTWDNPFPKWPAKPEHGRGRSAGGQSQDQTRYENGAGRSHHQSSRSGHGDVASPEQNLNYDYNGYPERYGNGDSQQQYDPRRPPEEDNRRPPPQQSPQYGDQPHQQRPGTASGSGTRAPPPRRIDIPPKSRTQPSTPVGGSFPQPYSAGPVRSAPWQEPNPAPGYQRAEGHSSLPMRPGTAPGGPNQGFDMNGARSASPEEMPAFDRSQSNPDLDPLHTNGGKAASTSEYVAYSPQDGTAPRNDFGSPVDAQGPPYGTPRNGPSPRGPDPRGPDSRGPDSRGPDSRGPDLRTSDSRGPDPRGRPNGGPAPNPRGGPPGPHGRPPMRRTATEGDESKGDARAPGPRPPPSNYPPGRDQRGYGPNGQPPPALDRQATSFDENPNRQPRNGPGPGPGSGPGPERRNPNGYPNMQGAHGGRRPQGSPMNGPGQPQRPNTASNSRADGDRQGSPSQGQRSGESPQPKADPDALPYHPTPVRPGLMQNGGSNPSSRPPPVRQYSKETSQRNSITKPGPITPGELSRLREVASRNPSDKQAKLVLAKRLSEASVVLADDGGRADTRMLIHNRDRFNKEGLEIVKALVASEFTDAMFYFAECYGEGALGLKGDAKEAFLLYQTAAKLGHAASAYRTAVCCEIGVEEGGGTRKDPQKAVQWYKRASSLGDIPATYKMGVILLKGLLGQQRNPSEAVAFLQRAADNANEENPHAVHELALLYENANGPIPRDEPLALELFKRAAKLGYKFSQFRLGQAYEYGLIGCAVDARSSIVWYTKAAAQGEHQSELALSGWYLTGSEGILEHNDTEAYLWARKAASADPPLPKAMFAMGYFTEIGIGCPRSLEEAKKWYARSASNNNPKAQERLEELRRGGSKVQRNREKLSRSNQKQNEENCMVM